MSVVGTGDTLEAARAAAYGRLAGVHLAGGHHRSDIALAAVRGAIGDSRNAGGRPLRVESMTDGSWERDFAAYVEGRGAALRGTAYLLSGNWHAAEDLTQVALTKLYVAWRRIDRSGSVDAYARQVLVRAFLDERRRPWRRERPAADPPDRAAPGDASGAVTERAALEVALRRLPRTQRAVLVLRYWGRSRRRRHSAIALAVSEGTVGGMRPAAWPRCERCWKGGGPGGEIR